MQQCVGKAVRTEVKRNLAAEKTRVSCHEDGKFNMKRPSLRARRHLRRSAVAFGCDLH